ncbi:hypothetical protein NQZ68_007631, partial [Dissostichus eleginoides]
VVQDTIRTQCSTSALYFSALNGFMEPNTLSHTPTLPCIIAFLEEVTVVSKQHYRDSAEKCSLITRISGEYKATACGHSAALRLLVQQQDVRTQSPSSSTSFPPIR